MLSSSLGTPWSIFTWYKRYIVLSGTRIQNVAAHYYLKKKLSKNNLTQALLQTSLRRALTIFTLHAQSSLGTSLSSIFTWYSNVSNLHLVLHVIPYSTISHHTTQRYTYCTVQHYTVQHHTPHTILFSTTPHVICHSQHASTSLPLTPCCSQHTATGLPLKPYSSQHASSSLPLIPHRTAQHHIV
jgi:hypothetical protein